MESYFSQSATTLPDAASQYRLVQKQNSVVLQNQGVPMATADTHHNNDTPSETRPEAALFSIALPFNTKYNRDRALERGAGCNEFSAPLRAESNRRADGDEHELGRSDPALVEPTCESTKCRPAGGLEAVENGQAWWPYRAPDATAAVAAISS